MTFSDRADLSDVRAKINRAIGRAIDPETYGAGGPGIQGAIDAAVVSGAEAEVLLPGGSTSLSATIHIGYGHEKFDSAHVSGRGVRYRGESGFRGTALVSTITNAPTISIQGARGTSLKHLTIQGAAKDQIKTISRDNISCIDEATWNSALSSSGVTPGRIYAPHCGVAIDPYCGSRPDPAYPDVSYPSELGSVPQYGKSASSNVVINDVELAGFEVGIVVKPSNADGNADFSDLSQCQIERCKYAISVGNTQSRNVEMHNLIVACVHTIITNRKHGLQSGRIDADITNLTGAELIYQIFDIGSASIAGQIHFQNTYMESIFRIGCASNVSTNVNTVTFSDSTIDMSYLSTVATHKATAGALISGQSSDVFCFNRTNFITARVASIGNVRSSLDLCFNRPVEAPSKAYEALGLNLLSGGIVQKPTESQAFRARMWCRPASAPSTVSAEDVTDHMFSHSGRDHCIPWACERGRDPSNDPASRGFFSNKPLAMRSQNTSNWTSVARSQRSITANVNTAITSNADEPYRNGILPGCALVHPQSGTVLFVRSFDATTRAIALEMQNNFYFDGSDYQILDTTFDPTSAILYSLLGLVYCPQYMLWGTVTSGSSVITNVRDGLGAAVAPNFGLTVGDRLAVPLYGDLLFPSGSWAISSVDTDARTITLSGGANASGRYALPYWFRTPPANEGSR